MMLSAVCSSIFARRASHERRRREVRASSFSVGVQLKPVRFGRGSASETRGEKGARERTGRLADVGLLGFGESVLEGAENLVPHLLRRLVQAQLDRLGDLLLDVTL